MLLYNILLWSIFNFLYFLCCPQSACSVCYHHACMIIKITNNNSIMLWCCAYVWNDMLYNKQLRIQTIVFAILLQFLRCSCEVYRFKQEEEEAARWLLIIALRSLFVASYSQKQKQITTKKIQIIADQLFKPCTGFNTIIIVRLIWCIWLGTIYLE